MPNPISGARVTLSSGDQAIARVTSDPGTGSFEIRLVSGIYDVKVEKDGFLSATRRGVVVDGNIMLPEVRLLWGNANGDGLVDAEDLVLPAKNFGKRESPWP